ncbi:MAG: HU family DNA-binding protein [Aggregatilineales bacterium]
MKHSEVIAEVARRLPHRTQRDVVEVVELLTEIWSETLMDGDAVTMPSIGRLTVEVQVMEAGGVLKQHGTLRRVYGRFRPTENLKEQLNGKT